MERKEVAKNGSLTQALIINLLWVVEGENSGAQNCDLNGM